MLITSLLGCTKLNVIMDSRLYQCFHVRIRNTCVETGRLYASVMSTPNCVGRHLDNNLVGQLRISYPQVPLSPFKPSPCYSVPSRYWKGTKSRSIAYHSFHRRLLRPTSLAQMTLTNVVILATHNIRFLQFEWLHLYVGSLRRVLKKYGKGH